MQISLLKQSLELQLSQSKSALQQLQSQFNQERELLSQQLKGKQRNAASRHPRRAAALVRARAHVSVRACRAAERTSEARASATGGSLLRPEHHGGGQAAPDKGTNPHTHTHNRDEGEGRCPTAQSK